jgi:cytochrome c biogenesis protein CcdA/thiol-disulfide isomerase/thioredoxin
MLLFLISFVAGALTVLAPCILPLLPVIVGGSVSGGVNRVRAYTIALSLGVSVILFTLFLKVSTAFIGVPQYAWMWFSGGVLILFGVITLVPSLWDSIGLVSTLNRESNKVLATGWMKQTFWGDVLVGMALGPVFSTCSPTYFVILATVLPASFAMGLLDLLAYAFGLVLMLLLVSLAGQKVVDKLGLAADPRGWFRKSIGILFVVVGMLVLSGAQQSIQVWLADHVFDVTKIEQQLLELNGSSGMPTLGEYMDKENASSLIPAAKKAMYYPKAPELAQIAGYVNTGGKPITIDEFTGKKVVLIDFWTYSCINCQRTFPYLKAWYDKYRDQGLEIIGVHTPEFAFERVQANVEKAVKDFGLKHPSVLDNNYGTWRAYSNNYWPRKYLIDIDGYIVYDHAGEGDYEETERAIQAALKERAERLGETMPTSDIADPKDATRADGMQLGSPEIYFGAWRNERFGSGDAGVQGEKTFVAPKTYARNVLYFTGTWNIAQEYAEPRPNGKESTFAFKYLAKNVFIVAGSGKAGTVEMEVTRDGKPLEESYAGSDVTFRGGKSYINVGENRLYKVIEDVGYEEHLLEFKISTDGLQVYTFTFG